MTDTTTPTEPQRTPRKAAIAAWIGSALEYYDFFIYGTAAALVFNKVFFPDSDPATGTLLAVATFGVGYAARPVGAFFMGHVGDRFGRKKVLVFTLLLMGIATFLVGCVLVGFYFASQTVYFVGTSRDGFVTVFRGLPYELPAGLDLYSVNYESGVPAASLAVRQRDTVTGHKLRSKGDAQDYVRRLEQGRVQS